eukprot:4332501-Prymnesium_polylepis.2
MGGNLTLIVVFLCSEEGGGNTLGAAGALALSAPTSHFGILRSRTPNSVPRPRGAKHSPEVLHRPGGVPVLGRPNILDKRLHPVQQVLEDTSACLILPRSVQKSPTTRAPLTGCPQHPSRSMPRTQTCKAERSRCELQSDVEDLKSQRDGLEARAHQKCEFTVQVRTLPSALTAPTVARLVAVHRVTRAVALGPLEARDDVDDTGQCGEQRLADAADD